MIKIAHVYGVGKYTLDTNQNVKISVDRVVSAHDSFRADMDTSFMRSNMTLISYVYPASQHDSAKSFPGAEFNVFP
jgi:hypothetical protein